MPLPSSRLSLLVVLVAACESPPSASSLSAWTPADHDRSEVAARQATQQPQRPAPAKAARGAATPASGPDPLIEATWAQKCGECHGATGRGDGPTGPMFHAADLTRPDWQASVTDEQLATVIRGGKGKMPMFPDLPPRIVTGLVARIRALKGR